MSMERLAVLAAIQTSKYTHHNDNNNNTSEGGNGGNYGRSSRYNNNAHEDFNLLLSAAMVSSIIIFVALSCYGCHKSVKKNRSQEYSLHRQRQSDAQNFEIFTTHAMLYEQEQPETDHEEETTSTTTTTTMHGQISLGPPPTYDSLIFNPHGMTSPSDKKDEPIIPHETIEVPKEVKSDEETKKIPAIKENEGLPTYEVALKLEAEGYV